MNEKDKPSLFHNPRSFISHNRGDSLLALTLFGAVVGMAGLSSFDALIESTSTTEFCLSCHEMRPLYEELERTPHSKNRAGVRVECRDCHVPTEHTDKIIAKFLALDDIYAHFVGTIDTPQKFESKRLEMAEKVWASMRENGSGACRSCHSFEAMELTKQASRPRNKHSQAMANGELCVDCHKGVAHQLPAGFRNDDY